MDEAPDARNGAHRFRDQHRARRVHGGPVGRSLAWRASRRASITSPASVRRARARDRALCDRVAGRSARSRSPHGMGVHGRRRATPVYARPRGAGPGPHGGSGGRNGSHLPDRRIVVRGANGPPLAPRRGGTGIGRRGRPLRRQHGRRRGRRDRGRLLVDPRRRHPRHHLDWRRSQCCGCARGVMDRAPRSRRDPTRISGGRSRCQFETQRQAAPAGLACRARRAAGACIGSGGACGVSGAGLRGRVHTALRADHRAHDLRVCHDGRGIHYRHCAWIGDRASSCAAGVAARTLARGHAHVRRGKRIARGSLCRVAAATRGCRRSRRCRRDVSDGRAPAGRPDLTADAADDARIRHRISARAGPLIVRNGIGRP